MMLFWYFNPNPNPASLVKQGHGDRRDEVMLADFVPARSISHKPSLASPRSAAHLLSRALQSSSARREEGLRSHAVALDIDVCAAVQQRL